MEAQPRQQLVSGFDEQAKVEGGALREVADVLEQCAILGETPVDEGYCQGGRAHAGHGDPPLCGLSLQLVYRT